MTTGTRTIAEDREVIEHIIAGFQAAMLELRCISSQRMHRQGVSMTHYHVMSMLERHGEMTMSRLAEMLDVSLSNTTGLVDRMEERGLVERLRSADDRRVVLARITPSGRQLLREVEGLKGETIGLLLARLDGARLERIALAMEDLRGALAELLSEDPQTFEHAHDHHRSPAASPGDRPAR